MADGKEKLAELPGLLIRSFLHHLADLRCQIPRHSAQIMEPQLLKLCFVSRSVQVVLHPIQLILRKEAGALEQLHYFGRSLIVWVDHCGFLLVFYVLLQSVTRSNPRRGHRQSCASEDLCI